MPFQRTKTHFVVRPDKASRQPTIPEMIIFKILDDFAEPGMLYTMQGIADLLNQHNTGEILRQSGFDGGGLTGGRNSRLGKKITGLWTNGYIRKFATGRFTPTAGGRVMGVKWEIKPKTRKPFMSP